MFWLLQLVTAILLVYSYPPILDTCGFVDPVTVHRTADNRNLMSVRGAQAFGACKRPSGGHG